MTRTIPRLSVLALLIATAAGSAVVALSPRPALAQAAPGDYTDETSMPTGRRGERIRQLLEAVSSGDPARIEALAKDAVGGPFRDARGGRAVDFT